LERIESLDVEQDCPNFTAEKHTRTNEYNFHKRSAGQIILRGETPE